MSTETRYSNTVKPSIKGVTGVILAGGKSSRFGRNKALVEISGIRLIERIIRIMGSIFESLILVSNTPGEYEYLQIPIYEDLKKGLGPIGGIHTGLEVIKDNAGFFVACDMPFINKDLIRHIVEVRNDFDAVVPRIDWKLEALHSLYTKGCIPAIEELIKSGELQTIKSYNMINVLYVDEEELRAIDPELRSFLNINRPDDLTEVLRLESETSGRGK
jgi:molybdopterin-guanine dinucleotide biosynthesis protein A